MSDPKQPYPTDEISSLTLGYLNRTRSVAEMRGSGVWDVVIIVEEQRDWVLLLMPPHGVCAHCCWSGMTLPKERPAEALNSCTEGFDI